MSVTFFAAISRMKYIERWALMRSSRPENLSEHAMEVAMIAHALCTIGNIRCGKNLNADRAAVIGLFHDASEIITGDMPTPVKYYSETIRDAYKEVEAAAEDRLLSRLPEDLRPVYQDVFGRKTSPAPSAAPASDVVSAPDPASGTDFTPGATSASDVVSTPDPALLSEQYLRRLVKAADKLSALIKCIEEENAGNTEFRTAKKTIRAAVDRLCEELPEVRIFRDECLPPYGHTLDELS